MHVGIQYVPAPSPTHAHFKTCSVRALSRRKNISLPASSPATYPSIPDSTAKPTMPSLPAAVNPPNSTFDFIVVGGGLCGTVIASRLREYLLTARILLLESGPDASEDPRTQDVMGAFALTASELAATHNTTPQLGTKGRVHECKAGRCLGGGSTINYGHWSRGHRDDYDEWGRLPGLDGEWSYDALLPYFKRVERCLDAKCDKSHRGTGGKIATVGVEASDPHRKYPLRQPVKKAFQALGYSSNADANAGRPAGVAEVQENWLDGRRQPANKAYDPCDVEIWTNSPVDRVLLETSYRRLTAKGVILSDGTRLDCTHEVIVCAGALKSPQILLLSGIGPPSVLDMYQIPTLVPNSNIGLSLFDHFAFFQYYRLQQPLALGSPALAHSAFTKGLPSDWQINISVPSTLLRPALLADGFTESEIAAYTKPGRPHVEVLIVYAPAAASAIGLDLPMDGYHIATSTMLLLPTSRGSVSISSNQPTVPPLLNPHYFTTHSDRVALVYGARQAMRAMLGPAMSDFVEGEITPPDMGPPLHPELSHDSAFVERIEKVGMSHAHAAGSCAMGSALDAAMRVRGVQGLRVCDASALPCPVGGHPQAGLYALAEKAADLIAGNETAIGAKGADGVA